MTDSPGIATRRLATSRLAALGTWFGRMILIPPTLLLILVAARFIGDPVHAATLTGVTLSTPEAMTHTRVMGAIALVMAFVIATAIPSKRRLRFGHASVAVLMAAALAVRMFGFAHDGTTLAMGGERMKTIAESILLTLNTAGFFLLAYLQKQTEVLS